MSEYTTGDMAKLCKITVRTVQYYDSRGILVPSALSEGGRRLYSEKDLKKLKLICCLRDLDLSISSIADILEADNSENVISAILQEQRTAIERNIQKQGESLKVINSFLAELKDCRSFSVDSINDIVTVMQNKERLKKVHIRMVIAGLMMDAIEIGTLLLWILKGIWFPFVLGMLAIAALGIWAFNYYYKNVSYICPECHKVFKASKREVFLSKHTPKARKLTCRHCCSKGWCVEIGD